MTIDSPFWDRYRQIQHRSVVQELLVLTLAMVSKNQHSFQANGLWDGAIPGPWVFPNVCKFWELPFRATTHSSEWDPAPNSILVPYSTSLGTLEHSRTSRICEDWKRQWGNPSAQFELEVTVEESEHTPDEELGSCDSERLTLGSVVQVPTRREWRKRQAPEKEHYSAQKWTRWLWKLRVEEKCLDRCKKANLFN